MARVPRTDLQVGGSNCDQFPAHPSTWALFDRDACPGPHKARRDGQTARVDPVI